MGCLCLRRGAALAPMTGLLLAAAGAGAASPAGPPQTAAQRQAAARVRQDAAAGRRLAREAIPPARSFGSTFVVTGRPSRVPPLTCPAFHPSLSSAQPVGAAVSATLSGGSSGPFVSETAYVYATVPVAERVWRRVVVPALGRCVREGLAAGSGRGVTIAADPATTRRPPSLGVRAAAYRVHGTAVRSGASDDVWLDELVLARGRIIAVLTVSQIDTEPAAAVEARAGRVIAGRLASAR